MTTNNHPAHGPVSLDRLSLNDAIAHADERAEALFGPCAAQHAQLAAWLRELQERRKADAVKVIDGAIAAFGTEPVAYMTYKGYLLHAADPKLAEYSDPTPLYTAPPAPVSVPAAMEMDDDFDSAFEHGKAVGWNACRTAMLQSFGNTEQLDEVGSWDNHMNTPTDKPAINTDELLKHIEGMEVSVDVSTCDADAGHRYFGTVTEISELDTARNGYILLVQDAKPNFKPAGNSPATPDGWQLVPKEPTEAMNKAGWAAMNEHDAINPTYRAMLAAAPQQDVRLALEIGMSRYAGAMQKLVDSGD